MVMFFIILTTAITLNRHGITNIETSRQAAEALRPFAGNFAATLFSLGIVGVGFLAIPTLAGSTAYAFAETLDCDRGLNRKLSRRCIRSCKRDHKLPRQPVLETTVMRKGSGPATGHEAID